MISRRVLLGTGAVLAAGAGALAIADATHRLDDVARAVGIDPKPEPDPGDSRLVRQVADRQNLLLARLETTSTRVPDLSAALTPFVAIGRQHIAAVGGSSDVPEAPTVPPSRPAAVDQLAKAYSDEMRALTADAMSAVSPALARVLASMAASVAQCGVDLQALR